MTDQADAENAPVTIFPCRSRARCFEHSLVLQATGIEHQLAISQERMVLLVPTEQAGAAQTQIALYDAENRPDAREVSPSTPTHDARPAVLIWIGALLYTAWLQTNGGYGLDWLGAGRMQAGLVAGGDWWRVFTALTLHLDLPHLLGNIVFGALFIWVAAQSLGTGAALLTVVAGGAAGNALNAAIQPATHSAIGASTAVFAALGVLSAYFFRLRLAGSAGLRWPYRWGPVIGGVTLLAFLGVGGERTDVMAHVTGFVCGITLGIAWGKLHLTRQQHLPQIVFAAAALGLMLLAWTVALGSWHSRAVIG